MKMASSARWNRFTVFARRNSFTGSRSPQFGRGCHGAKHNAAKRNMIAWRRCVLMLDTQIPSKALSAEVVPRFDAAEPYGFNRRFIDPSGRPTAGARQNAFSFSPGFFLSWRRCRTPERAGRGSSPDKGPMRNPHMMAFEQLLTGGGRDQCPF